MCYNKYYNKNKESANNMAIYNLTHGTPEKITKDNPFQLFDYEKKGEQLGVSGNGVDAYGPGIYAFIDDPDFSKAAMFSQGKFAYRLKVESESDMSKACPFSVPEEAWIEVVSGLVNHVREQANWDIDTFRGLLDDVVLAVENGEDPEKEIEALNEHLEGVASSSLDYSDYDISDYEDIDDWRCEIDDGYHDYNDPADKILTEVYSLSKSKEEFVNKIMSQNDNLWGVVKDMFNAVAVITNSNDYESFNKTFAELTQKHCAEHADMTLATVNDGHFAVIFDPNAIEVVKTHDFTRENEMEISL